MTIQDLLNTIANNNANGVTYSTQDLIELATTQSIQVFDSNGNIPIDQITLAYSGGLEPDGLGGFIQAWETDKGLQAFQVAEAMGRDSNGKIATIGQTDTYTLLQDDGFKKALEFAVEKELNDSGSFNGLDANQRVELTNTEVTKITSGVTNPVTGMRTQDGLWDTNSKRIMEAASGDVKTITPFGLFDKVFVQSELPTLLNNLDVTSIDGIPRELLLFQYNEALASKGSIEALKDVAKTIAGVSFIDSLELSYVKGDVVTNPFAYADKVGYTTKYVEGTNITPVEIADGTTGKYTVAGDLGGTSGKYTVNGDLVTLNPSQWTNLSESSDLMAKLKALGSKLPPDIASKINKLGFAGTAITLMNAAWGSRDAYAAGNDALGDQILTDAITDLVAEAYGGIFAFGTVGALLAAPLAAGGVAAIAATAAVFAAGFLGAVYGKDVLEFVGEKVTLLFNEPQQAIDEAILALNDTIEQAAVDLKVLMLLAGVGLDDMITNAADDLAALGAIILSDPLVIDMDGDGIELIHVDDSGVFFDFDNDGLDEKAGWVGADDALLVFDKNGNGTIDGIDELALLDSDANSWYANDNCTIHEIYEPALKAA